MAQWSVTFDIVSSTLPETPTYFNRAINQSKANENPEMALDVQYIQDIMQRFRQLSPDGTECSCLKALVLFRPGFDLQKKKKLTFLIIYLVLYSKFIF